VLPLPGDELNVSCAFAWRGSRPPITAEWKLVPAESPAGRNGMRIREHNALKQNMVKTQRPEDIAGAPGETAQAAAIWSYRKTLPLPGLRRVDTTGRRAQCFARGFWAGVPGKGANLLRAVSRDRPRRFRNRAPVPGTDAVSSGLSICTEMRSPYYDGGSFETIREGPSYRDGQLTTTTGYRQCRTHGRGQ
jgi:hypothetical protein